MRYWENDGKPITDGSGRYCYVIDPEDGTRPMRSYGRTREEALEKAAKTAETGQQLINKMRNAPPAAPAPGAATTPAAPAPTRRPPVSAGEVMEAAQAITNGDVSKVGAAVKTLLRSEGFDVDQMQREETQRRIRAVCKSWIAAHPEYDDSDRNGRILINKASLMVGYPNITVEVLDQAYTELVRYDMLFKGEPQPARTTEPTQTQGTEPTRVARPRNATSYSRNGLRAVPPAARREPLYTRAQIDTLNSKQLREKIEQEPGFREWYETEFSTAAA